MASETYSTWEFYEKEFGGGLDETQYKQFKLRAKLEIDRRTFGRAAEAIEDMEENLALCECELADAMFAYSEVPKGISSINNDGYSVTYGGRNSNDGMEDEAATLDRICRQYLTWPHNLLFAGGIVHV